MSNFNAESTYAFLQSDYEWEPSYYTVISLPIVWEVRIASSLRSRTGDEDPFLVGAVQDFVVNLSAKVRAPFVLICFFPLLFPSLPGKNLCGRPKRVPKNPNFQSSSRCFKCYAWTLWISHTSATQFLSFKQLSLSSPLHMWVLWD